MGAFTGSLSSLKEPMLGVSHAVLQGPLCLLSSAQTVLSEGHIWQEYTSVLFGQHKVGQGSVFKD